MGCQKATVTAPFVAFRRTRHVSAPPQAAYVASACLRPNTSPSKKQLSPTHVLDRLTSHLPPHTDVGLDNRPSHVLPAPLREVRLPLCGTVCMRVLSSCLLRHSALYSLHAANDTHRSSFDGLLHVIIKPPCRLEYHCRCIARRAGAHSAILSKSHLCP